MENTSIPQLFQQNLSEKGAYIIGPNRSAAAFTSNIVFSFFWAIIIGTIVFALSMDNIVLTFSMASLILCLGIFFAFYVRKKNSSEWNVTLNITPNGFLILPENLLAPYKEAPFITIKTHESPGGRGPGHLWYSLCFSYKVKDYDLPIYFLNTLRADKDFTKLLNALGYTEVDSYKDPIKTYRYKDSLPL